MKLVDNIPDCDLETSNLARLIEKGELDNINIEEFFNKINKSGLRARLVKGVYVDEKIVSIEEYYRSKRENNVL